MYIYICVYMCVYIYIYMCVYIYIYIYIYIVRTSKCQNNNICTCSTPSKKRYKALIKRERKLTCVDTSQTAAQVVTSSALSLV